MNTYKVELPDGGIHSCNSKRVFTHAVVANVVESDRELGFQVWAYAGSKDLAEKNLRTLSNRTAKNSYAKTTYQVVEVKVVA